jgi:hypothetical protein
VPANIEKNKHGNSEITDTEARTATECYYKEIKRVSVVGGVNVNLVKNFILRLIVSTKIIAMNCVSLDSQTLHKNDSQVCNTPTKHAMQTSAKGFFHIIHLYNSQSK